MANAIQSNPVYYSLGALNSSDSSTIRTVILHRRSDDEGFGIYIGEDIPSGLYIVTVERNSPAAEANIQPGDRVVAFNGQPVASIQNNPKEKLLQAAANSHSLALTIKSTDLYHSLEIPLVNSSKMNSNQNQNKNKNTRQFAAKHTIDSSTDLEGYIRSLFADQNIQILQAGTEQDLKPPAIPPRQSMGHPKSLPTSHQQHHHHHEQRKSHRSHRTRREHTKRITLVNAETQTSIENDENKYGERSDQSSSKRNNSSRPNMGINQIVSKNQSSNAIDAQKTSKQNNVSEFTGISPSSSSERLSSLPKEPIPSNSSDGAYDTYKAPNSATTNGKIAINPTMTHMADVVEAALHASRNTQNPDNRSQASTAQKTETDKQPSATIYTSTARRDQQQPTGRDQSQPTGRDQSQPTGRDQPQPTGRDQSQPTGRDQSQPTGRDQSQPTGRDQSQPTGRDQSQPTGRDQSQPTGRDQPQPIGRDQSQPTGRDQPPPYTETPSNPVTLNNQASSQEGAYHVPTGEITKNPTASSTGSGDMRNLHLARQANFQGFGFHIQYNKRYYLVQSVESDSPAAIATLKPNDVILYINGDKTENMPHATFVQIVNSSQTVDFVVQSISDYLRANPAAARAPSSTARTTATTPAAQALANQDDDKNKSGISKALGKFVAR